MSIDLVYGIIKSLQLCVVIKGKYKLKREENIMQNPEENQHLRVGSVGERKKVEE